MKIWSTMLYSDATSREMMQGTAHFRIRTPTFSASRKEFALFLLKKAHSVSLRLNFAGAKRKSA